MIMDHTLQKPYKSRVTKKDIFFISLSFFILIIFYFLPTQDGLTHGAQMMIGILIMAAVLWITEPIPLAVTGLLIMILQPLLGIISADNVFSSFGNQAIFFLIGALTGFITTKIIMWWDIHLYNINLIVVLKLISAGVNNGYFANI